MKVLNAGYFTISGNSVIIIIFIGCSFYELRYMKAKNNLNYSSPSVRRRESQTVFDQTVQNRITIMPDTGQIKKDINKILRSSSDRGTSTVDVEASGHNILLKGIVTSWNLRATVAHVAWSAPGVDKVNDQIFIISNKS